ncbi:MAG: hypothetical protein ACLTBV_31330 [Enterocloster bolteae]
MLLAGGILETEGGGGPLHIDACYGISMYAEQQNQAICHMLCTGCHSTCRLHFTRGEKFMQVPDRGESARQLWEARQQRKRTGSSLKPTGRSIENSIRRLMERIQNTLLVDLQPVPGKKPAGKNDGGGSLAGCVPGRRPCVFEEFRGRTAEMFPWI